MSLVSDLIGLASEITKDFDLQAKAKIERWISSSETGKYTYSIPIFIDCIEDSKQRIITTSTGQPITIMSSLTFLDPIPSQGASGRREPIDPRDRITAPSGFSGPIVDVGGTINPETGRGFITEVMLGRRG